MSALAAVSGFGRRAWRYAKGADIPKEKRWSTQTRINFACCFAIAFILIGRHVQENHRIGVISTAERCIEGDFFWLSIDHDIEIERGEKYFFKSKELEPLLADGSILIKYAAGLPGDRITVKDGAIFINGEKWGDLSESLIAKSSVPLNAADREYVIAEDEVLMLGDLPRSVDGRYLGPIKSERLMGTGVRLW